MKLVNIKIDVEKITKSRLFKGKKGTYLDLMIAINDEVDQFGNNASAWENQTIEERESKQNKNYLGNGKVIWSSDGESNPNSKQVNTGNMFAEAEDEDDTLPF